jgi:hypothetical protein
LISLAVVPGAARTRAQPAPVAEERSDAGALDAAARAHGPAQLDAPAQVEPNAPVEPSAPVDAVEPFEAAALPEPAVPFEAPAPIEPPAVMEVPAAIEAPAQVDVLAPIEPEAPRIDEATHSIKPQSSVLRAAPARARPEPASETAPPAEKARTVIGTIAGLLALLALAYLSSHERVAALEQRLGVRSAITAGFPFVGLGLLARHPSIGVLSDDVLDELRPLLHFGLGWLGFLVGFRLDPRGMDRLPPRVVRIIGADALSAFLSIGLGGGALMLAFGQEWHDATFLRDGLVLATAGAMTSTAAWRAQLEAEGIQPSQWISLDEVVGALGLLVLAAFFRPGEVEQGWSLPGMAWLFLTAGMGVTFGMLACSMLQSIRGTAEFMVIVLGSVAFASGMAAYMHLSPLSVCLFAGVTVTSFAGVHRAALSGVFARLERPIYLVFLAIAGALWDPTDYRGWLLMGGLVVARLFGLRLSRSLVPRAQSEPGDFASAPLSVLSIAVVVNAQTLYHGRAVSWLVTAVIGGAIATEVLAQVGSRKRAAAMSADGSRDAPSDVALVVPAAEEPPP